MPCEEFYSYNAKYVAQDSRLVIPASIPSEVAGVMQDLAVRAFKAIDGAGLARVDFFLRRRRRMRSW